MKRFVTIILMIICFAACQKAPFIKISGPRSLTFPRDGGTQVISFSCNRDWSVSSSESWIHILPSSGAASEGAMVTITVDPNTIYDPRTATFTLKSEGGSETITVSQDTGLGLIVSPTSFDLSNAEQTIEVEVQQNVNYTIEIDEAGKDWIQKGGTKALSTERATFHITANTTSENREGKITFKQTDGPLAETVIVKQAKRIPIQSVSLLIETGQGSVFGSTAALIKGTSRAIIVDIYPDNTTDDKTVHLSSSNPDIVSIEDGRVTGVEKGVAVVSAVVGDFRCTSSITVQEIPEGAVHLGTFSFGEDEAHYVFWAECNIGASSPEDYGDFFAWGETETKSEFRWNNYKWANGSSDGQHLTKYCPTNYPEFWGGGDNPDGKLTLDPEDDVAHVLLGGKWRMPTSAELNALIKQTNREMTSINGIKGYIFRSKEEGNTNSIFLPAAGANRVGKTEDIGYRGNYRSSSLEIDRPDYAGTLGFSTTMSLIDVSPPTYFNRSCGFSVRPVTE